MPNIASVFIYVICLVIYASLLHGLKEISTKRLLPITIKKDPPCGLHLAL